MNFYSVSMNILPYVHPVSMLFSNIMNIFSEKAEQKVDKTEKQIYNKTEVIIGCRTQGSF